ncbi:hypothetical protein V8D89_005437 [Ganoderma adspersum]
MVWCSNSVCQDVSCHSFIGIDFYILSATLITVSDHPSTCYINVIAVRTPIVLVANPTNLEAQFLPTITSTICLSVPLPSAVRQQGFVNWAATPPRKPTSNTPIFFATLAHLVATLFRFEQLEHRPQLIIILHPRKAMSPLASRASMEAYLGISPKLMIAIVGLFGTHFIHLPRPASTPILTRLRSFLPDYLHSSHPVVFLVIIIGFCLPANRTSCPSTSDRCLSGPESCQHAAAHRRPPARHGLALPVASIPRCPECKNAHCTANEASRVSQESILSPHTPAPYYARRAPTGILPTQSSQSERSASSSLAPSTTLPYLPLGYGARGPTATLRPAVW